VRIAIGASVTVGDMDVAVEPSWKSLRRVTGEIMAITSEPVIKRYSVFLSKRLSDQSRLG
jgi:hypothetical protein